MTLGLFSRIGCRKVVGGVHTRCDRCVAVVPVGVFGFGVALAAVADREHHPGVHEVGHMGRVVTCAAEDARGVVARVGRSSLDEALAVSDGSMR